MIIKREWENSIMGFCFFDFISEKFLLTGGNSMNEKLEISRSNQVKISKQKSHQMRISRDLRITSNCCANDGKKEMIGEGVVGGSL